jgi:cell division protein FtsW (lipid II flippase)
MMTSASIEIASSQYGDPFFHLKRQTIFALMGLAGMLITLHIPMHFWRRISWFLLMAFFCAPAIGSCARRWQGCEW